jgi:Carboxypeptidase regulatory-like domain
MRKRAAFGPVEFSLVEFTWEALAGGDEEELKKHRNKNSRSDVPHGKRSLLGRVAQWFTVSLILVIPALVQAQKAPSADASPPQPGSISGTIVDRDGALVANVRVTCSQPGRTPTREVMSDNDGYFIFVNISPGPFELVFSLSGFAPLEKSGILQPGENYLIPQVALAVGAPTVDVEVTLKPVEVAEEQIQVEEKQRLFGAIPNFYVSYVKNAVPLTPKQKFELAWKSTIDPVSFGITGVIAGFEQADNAYGGYGQGAQGYAKRYGAAYADLVSGTFIGGAILPSLFKQDPRYFYKGTGSRKSRLLYAVANAVICKGDNGHWQLNYSGIIGGLAAGGISNLYYPDNDRNGATLTFENALIGTGESAVVNVIQEFILRRLTPHAPEPEPGKN